MPIGRTYIQLTRLATVLKQPQAPISFINFVVKFVKNFTKHIFDVAHVCAVIFTPDVHVRHTAHVAIKPVDGQVNAVQCPAAEKASDGHGDVK